MAAIAIVGSLLSGIMGFMGAMQQGEAQQNMANYQAAVAEQNRQIALQNANFERQHGEQQAQTEGMKTKANVGAITAEEAGSGLDITGGSKSDVIASAQKLGSFNEAIIRNDSARKAYDYETQAMQDEEQSRLYTFQGENAKSASTFNAFGSLLGSVGNVASKWYQYGGVNVMGG